LCPPAAHGAPDEQRAREGVAGDDLRDGAAHVDVGRRHLAGVVADLLLRTVPELTLLERRAAPAADRAGVGQGAHVVVSGDDPRR
jgi:hypothetical protein